MHHLVHTLGSGRGGHFVPTHEFVVGRHGEALVNVLLRYDHLAHDAQHAIETLLNHSGDVSEETWGKGSPFNLQRDLEVRANDKLGGEHNYSDALNDEVAARIEKWYERDFDLFGFQRWSQRDVNASAHAHHGSPGTWVGSACAPVRETTTSTPPAFDVQQWPTALACRSLRLWELGDVVGFDPKISRVAPPGGEPHRQTFTLQTHAR